jgi:spore coat protein U-like protein
MTTLLSRAALAAAAMALGLSSAQATYYNSASGTLSVSLTVVSSCSVGTSTMDFKQSSLSSNADVTGAISVTCGSGTPYSITLGDGGHPIGVGLRQMTTTANGGGSLEYYLYTDSNRTNAWSGTTAVSGTGTGAAQSIPLYGRVPAAVGAVLGTYSDSVQITVSY